jgi:hypothetical protein
VARYARWRIFINESRAACSWFCGVTSRVKSSILITKFCYSKFPSTRFALDFFPLDFESLTSFDFDCPSPVFGPSPTGSARATARASTSLISAGWTSPRVLPLGFRFRRQIFRPRCRYFSFLFRYFGFLFTYFGFRFTYFGFPFRISVQHRCSIFVVRSVAPVCSS